MAVTLGQETLTPRQVAQRLKKDTDTVRDWIRQGLKGGRLRLRAVMVGGTWRVGERDLEEFLAALNPGGGPVGLAERQARRVREAATADAEVRRELGLPPA